MSADHLEAIFPHLQSDGYRITSEQANRPNCIGWALYSRLYFDPAARGIGGYFWPQGIRADDSVEAWCELFAMHQYEPCDDDRLEPETEKIAIYAGSDGEASHVARQLPSGEWTSKLGNLEDISHATLNALIRDPEYAAVVRIMKRPRRG